MERYDHPSLYSGLSYGVLISGHYQVDDDYSTSRPNGMDDWLIAYTISGRGRFETPDAARECAEGDVVLLKPGFPHVYNTVRGQEWNFLWAHFASKDVGDRLLPRESVFLQSFEQGSMRSRLEQAFRRIVADSRERSEHWHDLCVNALREILILLSQSRNRQLDPRIAETLHYLSVHMRSPIQIDRLSKEIGLSPSRLSHLFKEQTGLSVVATLNQMRIRQASLLLEHTDRSATEVAYDVGFHNYNHFIEQFRKWTGTNPSGFRKSLSGLVE